MQDIMQMHIDAAITVIKKFEDIIPLRLYLQTLVQDTMHVLYNFMYQ